MKRINKIIISIILLTLCSGCSINYNLEITKDKIKENIEVTDIISDNRTKETIYQEYQSWFPVYVNAFEDQLLEYDISKKIDNVEYHKKTIQELNNGYYYTYDYTYPISKFNDASTLRQAFAKKNFYIGNNYININTDNKNLLCNYSYFDELNVTITIDESIYDLNYTNAHNINDNKYTWNLNRDNCKDSEIILTLDLKNLNQSTSENIEKNNMSTENPNMIYVIYGIIILIVIIGIIIVKKMINRNDSID